MEITIIIILLVVLGFITLIGHGIWVVLAWLFRGGRPRDAGSSYEPTLTDDRVAAARYVQHLWSRGLIDQKTHAEMMRLIAEEVHPVRRYLDKKQTRDAVGRTQAEPAGFGGKPDEAARPQEPGAVPSPTTASPTWTPLGVKGEVRPTGTTPPAARPGPIVSPQQPLIGPGGAETIAAVRAPATEKPPAEPRRPFSAVLSAFMAEKNIRWGEVLGGLLILCCSTALVISLWSQIEAIPILKFLIFTAVTAALFGVGLFVHHRWKLPTTGHAVLAISSLLVPLNLLAFAALSPPGRAVGGWALGVEFAAALLFGWLTLLAARAIMPDMPRLFASGVVVLSASSLVIRFISPLVGAKLLAASILPVGPYVLVMALALWYLSRTMHVEDAPAKRFLLHLGVQTFACLAPFGLLLYESGHALRSLRLLSPMVCALAGPAMVSGLFLGRRLAETAAAQLRVTATSIALAAAAVMLLGVGLAWPMPSRLIPALLVNALAMVAMSRFIAHPAVHGVAAAWLTAAWVLALHLVSGSVAWSATDPHAMVAALLSARTGQAMVIPVIVCACLATWLHRRQDGLLSRGYDTTALVFAVISIGLVTWSGFAVRGDPQRATWVYLVYGVAALVIAGRLKRVEVSYAGCLLVQAAIIQALAYAWPLGLLAWPTAMLAGASLFTVAFVVLRLMRLSDETARFYAAPFAVFAAVVSLLTIVPMAIAISPAALAPFALRMAWVSALWAALAVAKRQPIVFAVSQVALVAAACAWMQHYLQGQAWYQAVASPWMNPDVWRAHLIVVGGLCLAWAAARIAVSLFTAPESAGNDKSPLALARKLLDPSFIATDRWISALALIALIVLAARDIWPIVIAEHGGAVSRTAAAGRILSPGPGSWISLLIVLATVSLHLWEGFRRSAMIGILLAIACGTAMLATRFQPEHLVVATWRWLAASILLGTSVLFWTQDNWLQRFMSLVRFRSSREPLPCNVVQLFLFVLFAFPVIVLTATFMAAVGAEGAVIPAGASEAYIRLSLLGPAMIVAVTLIGYGVGEMRPRFVIAAAGLACAAVTGVEVCLLSRTGGRATAAWAAWLIQLNAIVSSAVPVTWYMLQQWLKGRADVTRYPAWPLLIGRVAVALVLIATVVTIWIQPTRSLAVAATAGTLWSFAAAIAVECALFMTCRPLARIEQGHRESVWVMFAVVLLACALEPFDTGNWLCFHAMLVGFVAAGGARLYFGERQARLLLGPGWQETFDTASAGAGGSVRQITHDLTCTNCGYNLRGLSPSSRCPECGGVISTSLQAAADRLSPQYAAQRAVARTQAITAVLACLLLGTLFALRAAVNDPQRPWWSAGALVAISALSMTLAAWAPRRTLAYLAGIELCLAASVWWLTRHWLSAPASLVVNVNNLLSINIVVLVAAGVAWLLIERRFAPQSAPGPAGIWPAFHRAALVMSIGAVLLAAAWALYGAAIEQPLRGVAALSWLAWAVSVGGVIVCRIDPAFRHHIAPGLYTLALAGLVRAISQGNMEPQTLGWAISAGLAGYIVATTAIQRFWSRLRHCGHEGSITAEWLSYANVSLGIVSVVLAVVVCLTHADLGWRSLTVLPPLLCAVAVVLGATGARRPDLYTCTLALVVGAGVLFAWSWVSPDAPAGTLQRAIGLIAAVAAMIVASAGVTPLLTRESPWAAAVTRCVAGGSVLAGAALLHCCGSEAWILLHDLPLVLPKPAVAAMIAALALVIVCCILFAVRDRLDPLALRPSAREAYVYLAEVRAAILALHVRATMPWLFSGFIEQYWPILVMGLAFAASAAGEVCSRHGQKVLARPFGQTGLFLPVLAMLDLFIASSRVYFSIVLLTGGVLYAVLATMRRSIVLGASAGLLLTGSLWYLLHHTDGLAITEHPQLWFIPPSLAVLAAAHLNRDRLREADRKLVHYACLLAVYLSSTADIFLIGVAKAPWLPLVLAGLSVVGVLVGFASRVRSFLMLGTGFLCLSLLTMIWHAAEDLGWTWLWYVAGIVVGIAMLAVLGLLEKKRSEINAWIEQVRSWRD